MVSPDVLRSPPHIFPVNSRFQKVMFVGLVVTLSYLAALLGGSLVLRPQMVWPLWPGCALLVAVLLLTPRKLWPVLIVAGLAGFLLYDLRSGLSIRSIALLLVGDTVEVLIAALGVRGLRRVDSIESLARYSFFAVILAPLSVASIGALALGGEYWVSWRISLLTEALALLTLTPAILSWVDAIRMGPLKSHIDYFELAALMTGLMVLGYVVFVLSGGGSRPELLYSLLPFLLWAALRFGVMGGSTSMMVLAFLAIWGTLHGRGPFTDLVPLSQVWSLQLFLLVTAASFLVVGALADERRQVEQQLRSSEERERIKATDLAEAQHLAQIGSWQWDAAAARSTWSEELYRIHGADPALPPPSYKNLSRLFSVDSWHRLDAAIHEALRSGDFRKQELEIVRPDGSKRWVAVRGKCLRDAQGHITALYGTVQDINERKQAETVLATVRRRLIEAQEQERSRIARELHDDINQRMSLLALELHEIYRNLPEAAWGVKHRLKRLSNSTNEISRDIQQLSHQLHSSTFQLLGFHAAVRGLCDDLSRQTKIAVQCTLQELPGSLDEEIALTLFRMMQEGLHNIAKHSRAKHARVELTTNDGHIHVRLSDDGAGFQIDTNRTEGLGLISMRERLRLIGGMIRIDSAPSQGTTLNVWVPIEPSDSHGSGSAFEHLASSREPYPGLRDEPRTGTSG